MNKYILNIGLGGEYSATVEIECEEIILAKANKYTHNGDIIYVDGIRIKFDNMVSVYSIFNELDIIYFERSVHPNSSPEHKEHYWELYTYDKSKMMDTIEKFVKTTENTTNVKKLDKSKSLLRKLVTFNQMVPIGKFIYRVMTKRKLQNAT